MHMPRMQGEALLRVPPSSCKCALLKAAGLPHTSTSRNSPGLAMEMLLVSIHRRSGTSTCALLPLHLPPATGVPLAARCRQHGEPADTGRHRKHSSNTLGSVQSVEDHRYCMVIRSGTDDP